MPVVPGLPDLSLRFRLRMIGWFAYCGIWLVSLATLAVSAFVSFTLLVWSWGFWPSPLYAVPVSLVFALVLCTMTLFTLVLVVFGLDTYCSSGSLRVRYIDKFLTRLTLSLPTDPAVALPWLVQVSLPVLYGLLYEQGRLLREDDLTSPSRLRRLAAAESRLEIFSTRLGEVLSSPLAPAAAARFFSEHRDRYTTPAPQRLELDDPLSPPVHLFPDAPEVFFVLNGRHPVESCPLVSLDPAQMALRIWLRDARPLVKCASVRCMVAPGWLHDLLAAEHDRFSTPRAPLLPSVSDAHLLEHPQATVDIFVGLWSPPTGLDRALAAAATLARRPSVRATARPVA